MEQDYPVPPEELVDKWANQSPHINPEGYIAAQAARWGADMELEACCEYITGPGGWFVTPKFRIAELRAARRPNPPSLKEQAQAELDRLIALIPTEGAMAMSEPIRRALEQLPD